MMAKLRKPCELLFRILVVLATGFCVHELIKIVHIREGMKTKHIRHSERAADVLNFQNVHGRPLDGPGVKIDSNVLGMVRKSYEQARERLENKNKKMHVNLGSVAKTGDKDKKQHIKTGSVGKTKDKDKKQHIKTGSVIKTKDKDKKQHIKTGSVVKAKNKDKKQHTKTSSITKPEDKYKLRHGPRGNYVQNIYKTTSYEGGIALPEEQREEIDEALKTAKEKLGRKKNVTSTLYKLASKKAINNVIIISVVDMPYYEMAINLLYTSYLKRNITNFLFICMDGMTKLLLPKRAGDSYVLYEYGSNVTADKYRSGIVKTEITLELMLLGFTVIVTDLDVVFLKNPLPFLKCGDCDLMIQDNYDGKINTGVYLIKPTVGAVALQQMAINNKTTGLSDLDLMNYYASMLYYDKKLKVKVLDLEQFPPGRVYFDNFNRHFFTDSPCDKCVIVHHNFVKGYQMKVYRMKEMLMWSVDTGSHYGYYSCTARDYTMYDNPKNSTREQEKQAFTFAYYIAKGLERSVILPEFNCHKTRCNFIAAFGGKMLKKYEMTSLREHSFRSHPEVPEETRDKVSQPVTIKFGTPQKLVKTKKHVIVTLQKSNNYDMEALGKTVAKLILDDPKLKFNKILNFTSLIYKELM